MFRYCLALTLLMAALAQAADFAQPRPGLYTGGVPDAAQLDRLREAGVETVIDLRTRDELDSDGVAAAARERGMDYINLPIDGADGLTAQNAERLRSALDRSSGEVLLHCASGNRAGALLALMAHYEEGVSRRQALELGRRAGLRDLEPEVDRRLRLPRHSR